MIKKFFITFSVLIILAIVLRVTVLPKFFDRGKKRQDINYPSLVYEHEVSAKLQKLGVPHKIDENGILLFSRFNEEIVERVYEEVESKYFPEWDNYSFRIERYKNQFTSLLIMVIFHLNPQMEFGVKIQEKPSRP